MTGEMSKSEVTRENYPLYFAAADTIEGATVEPFDQYQGPYILVPGKGRYFLSSDNGYVGQWFSESADELSDEFINDGDKYEPAAIFLNFVEYGGTPVERD